MEQQISPNRTIGRGGKRPIAIVIHMTAGSFNGALSWLTNPISKVSAHYLIGKDGRTVNIVPEEDTAYHAGVVVSPSWPLLQKTVNPNLYTIGIEHENLNGEAMTPAQWRASTALIADIATRWNIPIDQNHIVHHNRIRANKSCPGVGIPIGS